jgi:glycosyltransferase involved in cell wall biosynthesis
MPMISALMVTQASRLETAALAIDDFAAQTLADRELVVLHDGDGAADEAFRAMVSPHCDADIRVERAPPGLTLGALRNRSVALARGEHVCQWDDDDRYHPERMQLQFAALEAQAAEACFLLDQLHLFRHDGTLYWDDWDREPYPMNVIQGTLLARRDAMPAYPELARGEDTGALLALLRARRKIARLAGVGWCYVYVHHGSNAWSLEHHAAISRAKAFGASRLLQRERLLREKLAAYRPSLGSVRMPHEAGEIAIPA